MPSTNQQSYGSLKQYKIYLDKKFKMSFIKNKNKQKKLTENRKWKKPEFCSLYSWYKLLFFITFIMKASKNRDCFIHLTFIL